MLSQWTWGAPWVEPESGTVDEVGEWTVHYEVGPMGLSVGGGIRVQFPNAWFVHPWAKRKDVQTDSSELPHYVFARTNRDGARLEVKIGRERVDGQHDRFEKGFDVTIVLRTRQRCISYRDDISPAWRLHG